MKSHYDLVVIGGGITGAGVAWDASLRGISTLLLERGDFGAETSAGCFKIAHGGLRYLQTLNFSRLLESAHEQEFLRRNAGCFLRPFEMLVPSGGSILKNKAIMAAAVKAYDILTAGKNRGFSDVDKLSPLKIVPEGISYGECYFTNSERFTYLVAKSAELAGADILNYTPVTTVDSETTNGWNVALGDGRVVNAKFVVNSTGQSWNKLNNSEPQKFSKGLQVVVPSLLVETGVARQQQSRSYFAYPWNGFTLLGTTDSIEHPPETGLRVEKKEVLELLSSFDFDLTLDDVSWVFGGYRLLKVNAVEHSDRHNVSFNPAVTAFRGSPRGLNVVSVKYTTFRQLAETVVDRVANELGVTSRCETKDKFIYSAPEDLRSLREKVANDGLLSQYGQLAEEMDGSIERELAVVSKDSQVKHLEDVLFRRSIVGFSMNLEQLPYYAGIVGSSLGWEKAKVSAETDRVKSLFKERLPWRVK